MTNVLCKAQSVINRQAGSSSVNYLAASAAVAVAGVWTIIAPWSGRIRFAQSAKGWDTRAVNVGRHRRIDGSCVSALTAYPKDSRIA